VVISLDVAVTGDKPGLDASASPAGINLEGGGAGLLNDQVQPVQAGQQPWSLQQIRFKAPFVFGHWLSQLVIFKHL